MILILHFQNIITAFAIKEYISACFTVDEGAKPNFRVFFDSRLPFIPKMFRMSIPVRENIGGEHIQFSDETIHILRLTEEPCVDEFEYEVPWSSQPSQAIDILFSWGENPVVFIENFRLVVMQDFLESVHILDGLEDHCRFSIELKKEIFDEHATLPDCKPPDKIDWHPERRDIVSGQTYCANFFTLTFKNVLVFGQNSSEELLAYEYYKFSVGVSSQNYGLMESSTLYLSRIYPCEESEYRDRKLKILVDPKAKYITMAFTVAPLKREYRIIYATKPVHKSKIGSNNFIFSDFVIEIRRLNKKLTYMDDAILLYFHRLVWASIPIELPGNTIAEDLAGVEEFKTSEHVLSRKFYNVDMSEDDLKVFKIKVVSKTEFEQEFTQDELIHLRRDLSLL